MAEQVTIQITENKTINVSDVLGNLKISTAAPTTQGLYMLSDIGTYTNLGGLVAEAGKVNYAYFDGSAWSLVSVDATIKKSSESFNLIEKVEKITGKYIDHSNGNLINTSTHTCTDFIEISSGVHYSFGKYFNNSFFAFYDTNKSYIADTRSANRIFDFKAPTGAKFVRVSYLTSNESEVYLVAKNDIIYNDWGVDIIKNYQLYDGLFVSQSSGGVQESPWTSLTDFISLAVDRFYGISNETYQQFAFYDENLQFIDNNLSNNGNRDFKVPQNAKYFRMTINTNEIGKNFLKLKNPKFEDGVIEISKGLTDFNSIQEAIDWGNYIGKPHTINIGEGIYYEALENKYQPHSFYGIKNKTIISDINDTDKKWECLQVATGYFEGIHFKRVGGGYAVHTDYAGVGTTEFFNCKIESAYGSAIGYGQQQDQIVKFRNCQFKENIAGPLTGILYIHNAVDKNISGGKIEFWYCDVYGENFVVRIDDANQIYGDGLGALGRFKPLFVGNSLHSNGYGQNLNLRNGGNPTETGAIIGKIVLDDRCFGNNIPALNK